MKIRNNNLLMRQADNKMSAISSLRSVLQPTDGWVRMIRTALNMSLRQLGERMSVTPQSVRDMERREKDGVITLKMLREAADALDMQLVYGFVPKGDTLEEMTDRKAYDVAKNIVKRTHTTMTLEGQANSEQRLNEATRELADEIKREMPGKLWD
jgi:predicted DNA-binding mobile mystery protein A